jgi:HEAT repeat protein
VTPETERLLETFRHGDPGDRQVAFEKLIEQLEPEEELAVLGEVLSLAMTDPEPVVRIEAAEAFGRESLVPWQECLISALRDDYDATVRAAAAESLGYARNRAALAALSRALDDDDGAVRRFAAGAIAEVGGSEDARNLYRRGERSESVPEAVAFLAAAYRLDPRKQALARLLSLLAALSEDSDAFSVLNIFEHFLRSAPGSVSKSDSMAIHAAIVGLKSRLDSVHGAQLEKLVKLVDSLRS